MKAASSKSKKSSDKKMSTHKKQGTGKGVASSKSSASRTQPASSQRTKLLQVKAETTLHQRLAELETLYESGLSLSGLLVPRMIGRKITQVLEKRMKWHHIAIRTYDSEQDRFEVLAFDQPGIRNETERHAIEEKFNRMVSNKSQGLSGWAVAHGEILRVGDLRHDERFADTHPAVVSGLYVPLRSAGRTIGVIAVESEKPNAFGESEERLLTTLGAQAAIALENANLFEKVRKELDKRQRAEDQLAISEAKLRAVFAAMADVVLVIDREGVYRDIAPTDPNLLYRPAEELLGKSLYEVFPSEQATQFVTVIQRVLKTNQTEQIEYSLMIGEKNLWFSASITPLDGNNTVWVARDITERKLVEQQLRQNDELLRAAIRVADMGVFVHDQMNNTIDWSPRQREIYGLGAEEIIHLDVFLGHIYPEDRERITASVLRAHDPAGDGLWDVEHRIIRRDGAVRWLTSRSQTFFEGAGRERHPVRTVGVSLDITERKQADEKIQQQLTRLRALSEIDRSITSNFNLQLNLSVLINHAIKQLGVDAADVLLLDPGLHVLEYFTGQGFHTHAIETSRVRLAEGLAGYVALNRELVRIPNIRVEPSSPLLTTLLAGENFASYYGVPLIVKGKVKGVLEIFHRSPLEPGREWLDFLNALAGQAALAIDNAQLFDGLQRSNADLRLAYDTTIEGWSRALDLRDKETEGHTQRVMEMTLDLARTAGMKNEELVHIRRGALLHDIGKMGIPDSILLKPDRLTDDERGIMQQHPTFAYELLSQIPYLQPALDIPYCHHEKWDGSGYPRGLSGEKIPLAARLFAVVDVWDALRSDRPYRKGWADDKVLEHIQSLSNSHFDPHAVELFFEVLGESQ